MQNDFSTRLKYFRSLRDFSQVELAKRIGISGKQVSDYEVGTSKPRQSTYLKILDALNVNDDIFSNSDLCSLDINDLDLDQVVTYSNTNGEKIILPRSFCSKYKLFPVTDISVFSVKGDSMSPTFLDGDLLLVDTTDKFFISGLIYLIYLYGEKIIARLYRGENGLVDISRDNQSFPKHKPIEESEIIILGKIIYRQGLI